MVSLQLINQSFHNHGEELKKLTQSTDLRTQNSNGSIRNHWLRRSISTNTSTDITIKLRISVIMVSMRQFMDLPLATNLSCHNHGEELRRLTQRMDSKIHLSNGSPLLSKSNKRHTETLVTLTSLRKFTDLPLTTSLSCHNHGEE
jgi:hypothetical protein